MQNPKIRGWVRYTEFHESLPFTNNKKGPTISGLCVVPALPFLFDHPVEHAVDTVFEKVEALAFGRAESSTVRDAGQAETKKEL